MLVKQNEVPTGEAIEMPGGRILFVTADRAAWQPIVTTLDEYGFNILETKTAVTAATRLDESPVDCVISDATIAEPDLLGFVDSVRDTDPSVPLLLLGDPDDLRTVVRAMERGATAHLAGTDQAATVTEIRRAVSRHAFVTHEAAIDDLKASFRRVADGVLSAKSRLAINAQIHDALTMSGLYQVVFVGQYDTDSEMVTHTHPLPGTLDPADFDPLVDAASTGLVDRAYSSRTITVASGSVTTRGGTLTPPEWRSHRSNQVNSLAAVPLVYDDVIHGLLLLGTSRDWAFDSGEEALLDGIRRLCGAGLAIVESRPDQGDIDQFTEDLLHELRNPLAIAKSHLELVRNEDDPEALRRVDAALDRIDRIIDTIGTATLDIVEETWMSDLASTAEEGWASVKTDDAELDIVDSRSVEADHDKLERLFSNLFRNAVTHGGSNVTVQVGTTRMGFYVEDDGPGIPPEHQERVFERGFSLGNGLGIGLDIVRRIVAAHGWEIEVRESELGGARFDITMVDTEKWTWNDTAVR